MFNTDNYDVAIFDLDGTLAATDNVWVSLGDVWSDRHGLPHFDMVKECAGKSLPECGKVVFNLLGLKSPEYTPESIAAEWTALAEEGYSSPAISPLLPGVKDFLQVLRDAGIKMAIATSNCLDLTEKILQTHGIREYFSFIATAEMVAHPKPSPDIYIKAAHELGVKSNDEEGGGDYSRTIVFEDSLKNSASVINAGMRLCGVLCPNKVGLGNWDVLSKMGDCSVVGSYDEINPRKKPRDFVAYDFDAAIFDLDGTLVSSDQVWNHVGDKWAEMHGLEKFDMNEECSVMSFLDCARHIMKIRGLKEPEFTPESVAKEWTTLANESYADPEVITIVPGAKDFLKALKEAGVKMAIATSNCAELTEIVLKAHGIREFFSAIVTSDDVEHSKPAPDIYVKAAHELGIKGGEGGYSRTIVFEDSMINCKGTLALGMKLGCVYSSERGEESWKVYSKMGDYTVKDSYDEINPRRRRSERFEYGNFDAAVFDLDGTLTRSKNIWEYVCNQWTLSKNLPRVSIAQAWTGSSFVQCVARCLEEMGVSGDPKYTPETVAAEWKKSASECYGNRDVVALVHGAKEFVQSLKENGVKVGIASSNSREMVNAVLKANDLEKMVDVVVTPDMVERSKPAPDMFVRTARELGVGEGDFARVVVFEDSMANGYGAVSVGMKLCGVFNPSLKNSGAVWNGFTQISDYFVRDSFGEIKPIQ